jgi:RimJ/RimL family protein N-acetyltransferase
MAGHLPFSFLPTEGRFVDIVLKTDRLTLRPFRPDDAPAVQELAGNWKVARMTARIPHPYPEGMAKTWITGQDAERANGTAYGFAIELADRLVGAAGIMCRTEMDFELGYWIGEPWWGQGVATEAATRVVRFAFEDLGAEKLRAQHHADNDASGRVLRKCGFRYLNDGFSWSAARGKDVPVRQYVLNHDQAENQPVQR